MKLLALLPLVLFGCKNNNTAPPGPPDMALAALGPAPALKQTCADKPTDVYTLPTGLPAMDDTHRGDVFHCATAESLTASSLNTEIKLYGYTGAALASGAWSWRFAYRTKRVTVAGTAAEGDSTATLLVPEKPLAGAPLVVFAHGSVGLAPQCAPSLKTFNAAVSSTNHYDYMVNMMALAGYGYTVVAPDYPGFSFGQVPGYFVAEDEAHALLDAGRAAAQLLQTAPDKVVIVGHSQGAHAALSAQSFARSYGTSGTVIGVVAFAPIWFSLSAWGGLLTSVANFNTKDNADPIFYAMDYFYSAGELRDGPGGGVAMYQASAQSVVPKVLVGGPCYDYAGLQALGTHPPDFFDNNFVNQVGLYCAISGDCTQGDAPKWKARWIEDRPALDPQGASVLLWLGAKDSYIPASRLGCVQKRVSGDLSAGGSTAASATYCYDAAADHGGVVRMDADWANQWIAARAGVGPEPAPCTPWPQNACTPPPNDY
jgi:pimeloyl-ACP methyl ester carboxylesterase